MRTTCIGRIPIPWPELGLVERIGFTVLSWLCTCDLQPGFDLTQFWVLLLQSTTLGTIDFAIVHLLLTGRTLTMYGLEYFS